MTKQGITILICGLLASCIQRNKIPGDIIPQTKMQSVLWDVIRAQTLSSELVLKDSTLNEIAETKELTSKVFQIHKIDSVSFYKSYNWYLSHPEVLKIVFDSMYNKNQREIQSNREKVPRPLKLNIERKIKPDE